MTETVISSRDNPLFKRLKKLADSARARREARMTLLDGEHLLAAYLDAGGQPHTLVRAASLDAGRFERLAGQCPHAKAVELSDALFAELAPVATPTGLLAEAAWLAPPAIEATPLVIVLEDIQDPGNLGSMLRTGAAAGATLAVLSKGCHDPWSPKALRGGQGAQFVLPLVSGVDIVDWLAGFEGESLALALAEDGNLYAHALTGALALIVGNEGAGLSQAVCAAASAAIRIPMPGRIESLNAAAALAVAVFEAARQRAT
ncbi:MAG: RNA methyltransferase [Thiobacillus sp.]|uniref:TrmH family RNA methyltransferase n=1 Tax=unclassified Thiobacillus TaxID=2646513 RepID=UPI00095CF067|nr:MULTISPECIES: RNA methyltransferase [unclassified Thiobacillus]MBN8771579.1 RNA methyltransferase [Thiobacillus sp.]MBN8780088.1 RNA methyltransferase [Thiobacillus sp.]MBS0331031.1 RNA methyltransferase [Pseudomonadota bacterium]OJY56184.1 MAG: tRNA methyltransferase [Thiobacillus sp. 0-1251]